MSLNRGEPDELENAFEEIMDGAARQREELLRCGQYGSGNNVRLTSARRIVVDFVNDRWLQFARFTFGREAFGWKWKRFFIRMTDERSRRQFDTRRRKNG